MDLLSLFVERSVDFHDNISALAPNKSENEEESAGTENKMTADHLKKCVDTLRVVSERDDLERKNDLHPSHEDRMHVLDLLVNTHTYGMEMKQAALSASTWLNAIGRTGKSEVTRESFNFSSSVKCISEDQMMKMNNEELRSLIKAAHTQLVEKNELNERLNNELSDCRAEIGRLKSVSRNEVSQTHVYIYGNCFRYSNLIKFSSNHFFPRTNRFLMLMRVTIRRLRAQHVRLVNFRLILIYMST